MASAIVFATPDPVGSLDAVSPDPMGVRVAGWALDPDTMASIGVHVYIDGSFAAAFEAHADRPDIGSTYAGFGSAHGFDTVLATAPGAHTVCAYGINEGAGANTVLGCRSVSLGVDPFGSFDLASMAPGATRVAGWAIDPDTASAIDVHVYVDGALVGVLGAGASRPDVAAMYPSYGDAHGFDAVLPLAAGFHTACAYGINQGAGTNALIGCRWVMVNTDPLGSLDIASLSDGSIRVAGWVLDPDTASPVGVHVYVDSVLVAAFEADGDRSDVAGAFPGFGAGHGFDKVLPAPVGTHNVCVYGINQGPGSNSLISCAAPAFM